MSRYASYQFTVPNPYFIACLVKIYLGSLNIFSLSAGNMSSFRSKEHGGDGTGARKCYLFPRSYLFFLPGFCSMVPLVLGPCRTPLLQWVVSQSTHGVAASPRNPRDCYTAKSFWRGTSLPMVSPTSTCATCNEFWDLTPPSGWLSSEGRLPSSSSDTVPQQLPRELWISPWEDLFFWCSIPALGVETALYFCSFSVL